jgi:glycosyltransferase involved in cell wall biosynthesis
MTENVAQISPALPSVSVVICCHNSAKRLPETLRHLAAQETVPGLQWEILAIDNASTDETAGMVRRFAEEHLHLTVRVVKEPRLGTNYARQRGMAEALCDTILFVDDDNWLAPNYVALVAKTLRQEPAIAALGGMSTACCEGSEPIWLSRYQGWYAVTGPAGCEPELREEAFLWTAGAAFRRQTLDRVRNMALPLLLSGRRGESLDAGEDEELSHMIRLAGCKLYRHTGLRFQHYLPAGRLTWHYLRRLHRAAGWVGVKLDAYRLTESASIWPLWILRSWCIQISYVCLQTLRYRLSSWRADRQAVEGDDRVLRWETYRGRLDALWSHRRKYRKMIRSAYLASLGVRSRRAAARSSLPLPQ